MRERLPPLHALRAFESAARLGRMTLAAQELCVTPGAISRQVRLLEQELGVALFEGAKSRPELSAAGRSLQPVLSQSLDRIAQALQEVRRPAPCTVDLACLSTLAVRWLIPRLFDFQTQYPGIEIRLNTSEAAVSGHAGLVDLVIDVQAGTPLPPGALALFDEHLGPVWTAQLAARYPLHSVQDILRGPLLHTRTRPQAWAQWCSIRGLDAAGGSHGLGGTFYEHYHFTLQAAQAHLGIALAPWHLVMDDVAQGRLLALAGFSPTGWRYVACPRRPLSVHAQTFCQWLQGQARGNLPVPVGTF